MPVNPIQLPQRQPKKDPMDKILQGLQIANEVFKIPVAYQDYQAKQADARVKGIEATSAENLQKGIVDPYAQTKNKLVPVPQQSALQPPGGVGPVQPPPPLIPGAREYSTPEGGKISLIPQDRLDKLTEERAALRKEIAGLAPIEIVDQAAQHYNNVEIGLNRGGKEGDIVGLQNLMRLFNPKVARQAGIEGADTLSELVQKKLNVLMGSKNTVLLPEERREFMILAKKAMGGYVNFADPTIQQYEGLGRELGATRDQIGIRDYSKYKELDKPAPKDPLEGRTATDESGKQHIRRGGKWVPMK